MSEILSRTIIEQTDSGEGSFILLMLDARFAAIAKELSSIRALLQAQDSVSNQLRNDAMEAIKAHRLAAQIYIKHSQSDPPPDWYPFVELPEGTAIRALPDGNKLFTLTDGVILRTTDAHTVMVVDNDGSHEAIPGPGMLVEVQPGRTYQIIQEWLEATHEQAGIAGLPSGINVIQVAPDRFSTVLTDGTRLCIDRSMRLVTISNPGGTTNIIGFSKIEGVGEEINVALQSNGERGFTCDESGHAGMVSTDGTVELSLFGGDDLVITFPLAGNGTGANGSGVDNGFCGGLSCVARQ